MSTKRSSISNQLQCFAHNFFVQHRPDLLPRVRRTSSANKRRPSFGQSRGETAFYDYGHNGPNNTGNMYQILGRCGQSQSATPPTSFTAVTGTVIGNGNKYAKSRPIHCSQTSSYGCQYVYSSSISSLALAQQHFVHQRPHHKLEHSACADTRPPPDSETESSDADDLGEESPNASALLKKSSAKVLWAQGQKYSHVKGDTSSESSPSSQSSSSSKSKLISKAKQLLEEGAHLPSLQKCMVFQQSPNLGMPPRVYPESPSLDYANINQTPSTSFWSPVLGSSCCSRPAGMEQEMYGYQQVLDFSAHTVPYMSAYPSTPAMLYSPTSALPPENMMSMPYHPGSPAIHRPQVNYPSPPLCNHGNSIVKDDNGEKRDVTRETFKKVVVKHELEEIPRSYSALIEVGEESSPPPPSNHTVGLCGTIVIMRERGQRCTPNRPNSHFTQQKVDHQTYILGDTCHHLQS
ncbi:uncharacterized protein LOC121409409 [Lytechinus variegatus]|uniref:uncharacterized protein LOC121409409 n=1 Tax=Lytechinus variegatus TaxID=7654 RepID=UPI001BB29054|nr:uncharacterized protein LOC121409409 [Lytechinus variegatus]